MSSRGGDAAAEASGGQFLLQLLQKPPNHSNPTPIPPPKSVSQSPSLDPAVTALGPPIPPWVPHPPHPHHLPFAPHSFFPPNTTSSSPPPPGFNQTPFGTLLFNANETGFNLSHNNDRHFGLGNGKGFNTPVESIKRHPTDNLNPNRSDCSALGYGNRNPHEDLGGQREGWRGSNGLGNKVGYGGSYRAVVPPPGFVRKPGIGGDRGSVGDLEKGKRRETNYNGKDGGEGRFTNRNWNYSGGVQSDRGLSSQLEIHGPHSGSRFNPVPLSEIEESMLKLHAREGQGRDKSESGASQKMKEAGNHSRGDLDGLEDQLASSLEIDEESEGTNTKEKGKRSRDKVITCVYMVVLLLEVFSIVSITWNFHSLLKMVTYQITRLMAMH
ncbi:hypothetical protein LIER_20440 [Lithospermum erythrorhizon]|uniref:Uncharacterized protein n=1 Tax=Lithospermum erythrorhizon TaxID=34254 RepID=A0AAV3QMW9_LITER